MIGVRHDGEATHTHNQSTQLPDVCRFAIAASVFARSCLCFRRIPAFSAEWLNALLENTLQNVVGRHGTTEISENDGWELIILHAFAAFHADEYIRRLDVEMDDAVPGLRLQLLLEGVANSVVAGCKRGAHMADEVPHEFLCELHTLLLLDANPFLDAASVAKLKNEDAVLIAVWPVSLKTTRAC